MQTANKWGTLDCRIEGVITALSSISHIGEVRSTHALFHKELIAQQDGPPVAVPTVTGNGIRGRKRDLSAQDLARVLAIPLETDAETGTFWAPTLAAHYFLFGGGKSLAAGARVNMARIDRLRSLVPHASLLGGSEGSTPLPSKLWVGKGIPICTETAHILPVRYQDQVTCSARAWLQREPYTRRDDMKDPRYRAHLRSEDASRLTEQEDQERRDKEAGEPDRDTGTKQQMRYDVQTLCAGAKLYWYLELRDVTPLEYAAAVWLLLLWMRDGCIGGMVARGHGRIALELDETDLSLRGSAGRRPIDVDAAHLYHEHLESHADEMREVLDGIR